MPAFAGMTGGWNHTGPPPFKPRRSRRRKMKALVWHGRNDVRCDTVPDPRIEAPRDAIVKVTSTAICGSDLHLYDGYIPAMESGDVLGHELSDRLPGSEIRRDRRRRHGGGTV